LCSPRISKHPREEQAADQARARAALNHAELNEVHGLDDSNPLEFGGRNDDLNRSDTKRTMQTQVVFDSTSSEARWLLWYSPLLFLGGLLVLSGLRVSFVNWKQGWGPRLLGLGLAVLFICAFWFKYSYNHWIYFTEYHDSGPYQTVEGPVENYLARPAREMNFEQFTVNGVRLGYGSLGMPKCFSRPAANGGPIREGLPVRIAYKGSCIVKLEILKSAQAE